MMVWMFVTRILVGWAIRRASRELRHLGDEGLVLTAPVDYDLISAMKVFIVTSFPTEYSSLFSALMS